jgi:Na+/proline symporter
MLDNLDNFILLIFVGYLLIASYQDIGESKNINAYAVGRRSFSTFALGATITATFVSGSGFVLDLTEFYQNGWTFFFPVSCMIISFVLVATFIVPKMKRFLGKTSVAMIMGEEYGQKVRFITAITGVLGSAGMIAIQFKIMGNVAHTYIPDLSWQMCAIIFGLITTGYTVLGGIHSVVHTDTIQSICFVISVCVATTILYTQVSVLPLEEVAKIDRSHFDIMSIFTLKRQELEDMILLGLYFLVPGMSPTVVQRISMGFSISQVRRSYLYSSLLIFIVILFTCLISYLLFEANLGKPIDNILEHFLKLFTIPGTTAIVVIGVLSMCMSTADSNINICSVLIANDMWKVNVTNNMEKLLSARYFGCAIGIISILFSLYEGTLLSFLLSFWCFYMGLVSIPFLAVIFGFKITERCCLITMGVVFSYVIIFKFILNPSFNIIAPAMLLNLIVLVSTHYLIEKWEVLKCFGIKSKLRKNV